MKPIKLGLRVWIAITAVVSFLTGWAMLAHSGKPAPLSAGVGAGGSPSGSAGGLVLPTLAPIPSLNNAGASASQPQALQPLQVQPVPFNSMPSLSTRGS